MRILFCTNSLGARGGIERVTIVKANALAAIPGNEVAICFTDRGTYPEYTIHPISDKVKVYDLGVSFWDLSPLNIKNLTITAPKKFFALRRAIRRVADEFRPDVLISTGSYEKYALATMRFRNAVKIREYHFCSNYRQYIGAGKVIKLAGWFDNSVLGRGFDCNYLLTKEDKDHNFADNPRYGYQHNPCSFAGDSDLLAPTDDRQKIVLAVGRLHPQKNFAALLDIWSRVAPNAPGWQLWIAGEGEEKGMLEKAITDLGISESTQLLGFRSDIKQLLSQCSIMAMTSKYEGMPLNLIEAMHEGTAVISYASPCGPRDIITDGVDGLLVDYNNKEQFAEKLTALINDKTLISRLSEAARRRATDFTPYKIAAQWMEHYTKLLDAKRHNKY